MTVPRIPYRDLWRPRWLPRPLWAAVRFLYGLWVAIRTQGA